MRQSQPDTVEQRIQFHQGLQVAFTQVTETITQHGGTKTIRLHDKVEALSKLGQSLRLFDEDKLKDLNIAVQVVNVR